MRREKFDETLVSLFRFTQISGIAVCENADISVAERTDLSSCENMPVATAAKD
jgi:hypothetical protein